MKNCLKNLKMYTAVFACSLLYMLYGILGDAMPTLWFGFNLYLTPPYYSVVGLFVMIAAGLLWLAAVILGIVGYPVHRLRKGYFIYMLVCYGLELIVGCVMPFVRWGNIPLDLRVIFFHVVMLILCIAGLCRAGKDVAISHVNGKSLSPNEINSRVEALHDKLDSDL